MRRNATFLKSFFLFTLLFLTGISATQAQTYLMSATNDTTCSGVFYDTGGAAGNYGNNQNITKTFVGAAGQRISFAFTSFATESCCDYMDIWDGPTTAHPYIGRFRGTASPGIVTSTGTALTFRFVSDNGGTNTGWQANISCAGPALTPYNHSSGTVTACEGAFYDAGGPAINYPDNENRVQTFCSGTTDHLEFTFNNAATGFSVNDTLFVFDGPSTASAPLAAYTANSLFDKLTSSGTCLTFFFKSNSSNNASGWHSTFTCVPNLGSPLNISMSTGIRYVCDGNFYDRGGASGNYGNSTTDIQTFGSYNGNRISFNFTLFDTEACCDYLEIYDGPSTASPLIGTYRGTTNPGLITSTGRFITFRFVSDNGGTDVGWAAAISCAGTILPPYNHSSGTVTACQGVFYDAAGPSVSYPNNENRVQTFCSGTTDHLQFTFNNLALAFAAGDSLYIYDGPSTASNPLAVYTVNSLANPIVSSGTCLTFRFMSNTAGNAAGWQAIFECVSTAPVPQDYRMSTGIRYVCDGNFYDRGGPSGNYANFSDDVMTLGSYNGNRISVNFTSFSTEGCCDYLEVFDGPTTAHPLIGIYRGSTLPGLITSTGRFLTFRFISDGGTVQAGWAASISCSTPTLPVYVHSSGTTTACSGVFYDAGGAALNYPHNENRTQTFCSGTSDRLEFRFNNNALAFAAGDSLYIYDGPGTSSQLLAVYTTNSIANPIVSAGTCLTFQFRSNATGNAIGWQAVFACVSTAPIPQDYSMSSGIRYVCDGNFFDRGGPTGNYANFADEVMTFGSYNGNRLSFNFTSMSTEGCCDYLEIYDGPTTAYPLIGVYRASTSPGLITSTGRFLTFHFVSDGGSVQAGWAASISCSTPIIPVYVHSGGTTTACQGVFYDAAGPNVNYPHNENRVQTFCSGSSDHLEFRFNNNALAFGAGDSLYIYDGPTTASNPLAVYTLNSLANPIVSLGSCLTFEFRSNATVNAIGWQAVFECVTTTPVPQDYRMSTGIRYVCDGNFFDRGGPTGNYANFANEVQTLGSYNGNRISLNFTAFSTEGCCDYLEIYDGPTTAYPLIGTYRGSNSPGIVTSTGRYLTFRFVSDGGTVQAGWAAAISCAGPVLPVYVHSGGTVTACEGVFYDAGGPSANYPHNENRVQTFCSGTSDYISFTFNNNAFQLAAGDTLWIYDGNSTAAQPLAAFTEGSIVHQPITSSGTCLTFRFKSNATGNGLGWQGEFKCTQTPQPTPNFVMSTGIRWTCGGNFYDVAGPSGNYGNFTNQTMTVISTSGCGLRVDFTAFNTENCCDRLYIYDGTSTAAPLIGSYGGNALPPAIQSTGTALTFRFTSDGGTVGAGWAGYFSCPTAALATVTPSTPQNICQGDSVTLTASNGASWLWSNGATTQSITVSTAGQYYVRVTDGSGCSGNSASVPVQVNSAAPASITPSGPTTFCPGSNVVLTASSGNTYLWNTGATTASINVTNSGTYTVTVTSINGCGAGSPSQTITVLPAPSNTVTPSGPTTFCTGGSVNLSAAPAASYLWSNGATTQTITVSTTGTYTVTVTGANGCTATSSPVGVTVTTPSSATITPDGPTAICQGSIVNLAANPGQSYLWNTGATTQSIDVGLAGTYTVTVTYAGGCSSTSPSQTVNVLTPSPASVTPSGATTFCQGGNVTLTANAGSSYLWSNGATTQSISATTTGNYTVTVTGANGCPSTASQAVTVNALPSNTVTPSGPTTFCAGSDVTLTAASATGYLWSNGATTQSITVSSTGNYSVTLTNAAGCSNTSTPITVTVTTPTPATITPNGPTTVCQGSIVNLAANPGQSYLWSNGATTQSINVTNSGTFTVTVTYANGCVDGSAPTTVTVLTPAPASITPSGSTSFCQGGSVTLTANTGNSYLWSTGATTQSINTSNAGNYTVTVTGSNGCPASAGPLTVTVNALPSANITPRGTTTICQGSNLTLTADPGTSYLWSTGATTQSINTSTAGSYTVTVTGLNGCTNASSPAIVNISSTTQATITPNGPTTFCQGDNVILSANAGQSYLWSTGATTQSINVSAAGNYTVTVTYVGGCNSVSSATTTNVIAPTPASITPSGATSFCAGGSVNLTATTGTAYLWSTGASTQSITATTSGNYTVTVTGTNGCDAVSSPVTVTALALPSANITPSGSVNLCPGGSVVLNADLGTFYAWSTGATSQAITVTTSGTYTVTVTGSNGCTNSSSPVTVNISTPAQATITPSGATSFCQGDNVTLTANNGQSYLWSNGATTQSITVTNAGNYTVTVTYPGGCNSVSSATSVTVFTPSAASITPSGPTSFCAGGSVNLSASTGTAYLWSNGATSQSITVTTSGTYSVTVTDVNGCEAVATSVTVNTLALPSANVNLSGPATFCQGGSLTLTADPASSYLWSNGATSQSITVTSAGSYTVTVTGVNGCTNTSAATTVTVITTPTASITPSGPTTFCQGDDVTLTATTGQSYLWSNGATSQSITVSGAATYTVTVTYAGGCNAASSPVTVIVNALPTVNLSLPQDTLCSTDPAFTLTGGSPAGGTWSGTGVSGGVFSPSAVPPGAVTITYTYTDANACSATATDLLFVDVCVGIEAGAPWKVHVWPNPATTAFNLSVEGNGDPSDLTFTLTDLAGHVLIQPTKLGAPSRQISTTQLATGTYILTLYSDTQILSHERIVIH